jgi:hypothetical protein
MFPFGDDHEDSWNEEQCSCGSEDPKISPPITARPRGAFCSPPSPRPNAIGIIPIIIAIAVMSTRANSGITCLERCAIGVLVTLVQFEADHDDYNAIMTQSVWPIVWPKLLLSICTTLVVIRSETIKSAKACLWKRLSAG